MLLPYTTLTYYGPGAAAAVETAAGAAVMQASGLASPAAAMAGAGVVSDADATRLVNRPMAVSGSGTVTQALPKGRARPALHVKVGQLSQDDVVGAVQQMRVEGSLTLVEALRIILAALAGDGSDLDGNPVFKSMDGTKTRLAATIAAGTRTITTRDAT